jgi:hypothetical protein
MEIIITILICLTIIICYLGKLWFESKQIYVDEPVEQGNITDNWGDQIGYWERYKRTYTNGKVTYIEKNYK